MQMPEKNIVWIKDFIRMLENVDSDLITSGRSDQSNWNDLDKERIQILLKDTVYLLNQIIEQELFRNAPNRFFFSLKLHMEFCENQLKKLIGLSKDEIQEQHFGFLDEILCLNGLIKDSGLFKRPEFTIKDMNNSLYTIVEEYRANS